MTFVYFQIPELNSGLHFSSPPTASLSLRFIFLLRNFAFRRTGTQSSVDFYLPLSHVQTSRIPNSFTRLHLRMTLFCLSYRDSRFSLTFFSQAVWSFLRNRNSKQMTINLTIRTLLLELSSFDYLHYAMLKILRQKWNGR